jgi:hypothetical protein
MRATAILVATLFAAGCHPPDDTNLTADDRPDVPAAEPDPGPDPELEPVTFDGLDPAVVGEILAWKKGDPPPPRLVKFRDPPPPPPMMCGFASFGTRVRDIVNKISDSDLLEVLLFDPQVSDACARAAGGRLVELRGVKAVRALFAVRQATRPVDVARPEPAALARLIGGPCARIRVASVTAADTDEVAALRKLRAELSRGVPWKKAYMRSAYGEPGRESESARICYEYAGVIAADGTDVVYRYKVARLEAEDLRRLFELKGGIHDWESGGKRWLYCVEVFDDSRR